MHRFLDCLPVLLRDQDGRATLTGNKDWLMRFGGLVNEAIEIRSCFAGCEDGQKSLPVKLAWYAKAYDVAN